VCRGCSGSARLVSFLWGCASEDMLQFFFRGMGCWIMIVAGAKRAFSSYAVLCMYIQCPLAAVARTLAFNKDHRFVDKG
jgi:hypothetical protein